VARGSESLAQLSPSHHRPNATLPLPDQGPELDRTSTLPLASSLSAEIARWFENTRRLVDQLAETAQRQEQLEALVAALERDNEQLRRELEALRTERANVAEILRALADDLNPT